jgi:hypothetical protein
MTDLEFQDMVRADSELIKWRNNVDLPKVRNLIFEHKQEMGREGEWLRINSLTEQIGEIDDQLFESSLRYEHCKTNPMSGAMVADGVKRLLKSKDKLSRERGYLLEKGLEAFGLKANRDYITPDMIERAKEYPIDTLIDTRTGFALCLYHSDRKPSMYVKNNFAHCFSCGKTADTIDVYRKLYGATFPDAVRALQ